MFDTESYIYSQTLFTGITSLPLQETHTFISSFMHTVILNYAVHIFKNQLTAMPSIPATPGGPGDPAPALCSKIVSKLCCHIPMTCF